MALEGEGGASFSERRVRLLAAISTTGSITNAAKAVGISYKTAWDAVDAMNNLSDEPLVARSTGGKGGGGTRLTAAGERFLADWHQMQEEHNEFIRRMSSRYGASHGAFPLILGVAMKVSARNVYLGKVTAVKKGAVNAEVDLELSGGAKLVSVVTNDSVDRLSLAKGGSAYAFFKASAVILGTDLHKVKTSARNLLCGTITRVTVGAVNDEVTIDLGGGNTLVAVVTKESADTLGLAKGGHACALVKASSVLLGVAE